MKATMRDSRARKRSASKTQHLIDESDLFLRFCELLLDVARVGDVLLHEVQLAALLKLGHASRELLELERDALALLQQLLLAGALRFFDQLKSGERWRFGKNGDRRARLPGDARPKRRFFFLAVFLRKSDFSASPRYV